MIKKFLVIFLFIFCIVLGFNKVQAVGDYGPNWDKPVIKVYIEPNHAYSEMFLHAFQKWENSSYGQLKFEYVTQKPADIETSFVSQVDGSDEVAGSYSLLIKGGKIDKAEIFIVANPTLYSNQMIYTTMLHEVGHALGLGNSNRKLGIMHSPVEEKQDIISNDIVRLFRLNGWSFMNKGTYSSF